MQCENPVLILAKRAPHRQLLQNIAMRMNQTKEGPGKKFVFHTCCLNFDESFSFRLCAEQNSSSVELFFAVISTDLLGIGTCSKEQGPCSGAADFHENEQLRGASRGASCRVICGAERWIGSHPDDVSPSCPRQHLFPDMLHAPPPVKCPL